VLLPTISVCLFFGLCSFCENSNSGCVSEHGCITGSRSVPEDAAAVVENDEIGVGCWQMSELHLLLPRSQQQQQYDEVARKERYG